MDQIQELQQILEEIGNLRRKLNQNRGDLSLIKHQINTRLSKTFTISKDFDEYSNLEKKKEEFVELDNKIEEQFEIALKKIKTVVPKGAQVNIPSYGILIHNDVILICKRPLGEQTREEDFKNLSSDFYKTSLD
ncbi:MAG: hypothetical protein IPO72_00600 [Saprospiraceae bacterium]|nr:hypothetical protein [Candidatus Vicinibacter affinis]MBP7305890.1 hypothetical protein [Saprospiraceae bacterium]MBK6821818.1 hypothetical protein [Candidatus Vicinibacter affinis]MBK7697070.1 hypothetical protein [Candidatus Vicinibacter affinis]MBK7800317.1 hypothetical protein [Candidatus Vicinibacter affinis]